MARVPLSHRSTAHDCVPVDVVDGPDDAVAEPPLAPQAEIPTHTRRQHRYTAVQQDRVPTYVQGSTTGTSDRGMSAGPAAARWTSQRCTTSPAGPDAPPPAGRTDTA